MLVACPDSSQHWHGRDVIFPFRAAFIGFQGLGLRRTLARTVQAEVGNE